MFKIHLPAPPVWFVNWLIKRAAAKDPDDIVDDDGSLYMARRSLFHWRDNWFDIGIKIHTIMRSDNDPHCHDHPWRWNISWILREGYSEEVPIIRKDPFSGESESTLMFHSGLEETEKFQRVPGDLIFRGLKDRHRLDLNIHDELGQYKEYFMGEPIVPKEKPCISLFITGPYAHGWGFFVDGAKVPYRTYLEWRKTQAR